MDLLLIPNENKFHYVSMSHYVSKILTYLWAIKQKIKIKNIFVNVLYFCIFYNVLVVKKI